MSSGASGDSSPEKRAADLAAGTQQRTGDLTAETAAGAGDPAGATAARAMTLASALSETLGEIARRLDQYSAFGQQSREIITKLGTVIARLRKFGIALAASFALDITLTIVLGFTAFSAHDTASANSRLVQEVHAAQVALHASQLSACANGNIFRANQTTIWRDFIGIAAKPSPGESAAQIAKANQLAAGFLDHVSQVNHQIDCTALYGK